MTTIPTRDAPQKTHEPPLATEDEQERIRAGLHQSQAMGNRRSHPGHRRPFDGLWLGHRHLQHARGVVDSHLRHIFKLDGRRQARPSEFPRRIMIDLFDGKLKGTDPARVHFAESVEGEAVDYDFNLDVGLIRMRPGRELPASRVVPASWDLQSRMKVLTVGCSEGRDATAWHTVVSRPRIQNFLSGNPNYEAIECDIAPKEGRSGGGLYTIDGYVVGRLQLRRAPGQSRALRHAPVDLHASSIAIGWRHSTHRSGAIRPTCWQIAAA